MRIKLRKLIWIGFAAALLSVNCGEAQDPSEPQLKAAFLYNFARFTKWPSEDIHEPLHFCVLRHPQVADQLRLAGPKKVQEREVVLDTPQSSHEFYSCNLVYIGDHGDLPAGVTIENLYEHNVLVVSDSDREGVIRLAVRDERIHFSIDLDAASRARLQLSSQLLNVASSTVSQGKETRREE